MVTRSIPILLLVVPNLLSLSCKTRSFDTTGTKQSGSGEGTSAQVTQVDPMRFDAYLVWKEGQEWLEGAGGDRKDWTKYPKQNEGGMKTNTGYGEEWPNKADGIFYVPTSEFFGEETKTGRPFTGKPTRGATVEGGTSTYDEYTYTDPRTKNKIPQGRREAPTVAGGTLVYPVKEGRQLRLTFTEYSDNDKSLILLGAADRCAMRKQRLPTIRELFDYCTAGTNPDSKNTYPNHRCGSKQVWSASFVYRPNNPKLSPPPGWFFSPVAGMVVSGDATKTLARVKPDVATLFCVGEDNPQSSKDADPRQGPNETP